MNLRWLTAQLKFNQLKYFTEDEGYELSAPSKLYENNSIFIALSPLRASDMTTRIDYEESIVQ